MKCQNCNVEIENGVQICPNCSAIINNLTNNEPQSSLPPSFDNNFNEVSNVKKKKGNLKVVLLVVALLVIILFIIFMLFRKKSINDVGYLMKIDDVYVITGKGIAVFGKIDNDVISTGDMINIVDLNNKIVVTTTVVEIQLDDLSQVEKKVEVVEKAKKGDRVILILGNIHREYYKVGYKIVKSSSLDTNNLGNSNTENYDKNGSFLMDIEEVTNENDGTYAKGTISRGTVTLNDIVQIIGLDYPSVLSSITQINVNNQNVNSASAGDFVSILLKDSSIKFVAGQTLAKPDSIEATTKFEATIYMLSKEEGGRYTAIYNHYRPMFRFRTNKNSGQINFLGGIEMMNPGDKNVQIEVELTSSMALEVGMEFSFYEGGRTVGKGTITKIN